MTHGDGQDAVLKDLGDLWQTPQQAPASDELGDLLTTVQRQTLRWRWLIAMEAALVVVGVLVPLLALLEHTSWGRWLWALDIWAVVLIGGWFTWQKARFLVGTVAETTQDYVELLIRRHQHQMRVARAGLWLAGLQFVVVPLVVWLGASPDPSHVGLSRYTSNTTAMLLVLLGMGIYMVFMARQLRTSRRELQLLAPTARSV